MGYVNIDKIQIKNFRNLSEVELDFRETPIISLVGDNESGKTSVVKAIAVASMHAYAREQAGFIRDGTRGFGVIIELENGVAVRRLKRNDGVNHYSVVRAVQNGKEVVWETNKIDSGLPYIVSEIMGMVEETETKELLHIRTYEDKLLFITTPASTNYKVMYNALKVEQLTKAIKLGSDEVNELRYKTNRNYNVIDELRNNIRDVHVLDIEPVINIRNRILKQKERLVKLDSCIEKHDRVNAITRDIGSMSLLDSSGIGKINELLVSKVIEIGKVIERIGEIGEEKKLLSDTNSLKVIDSSKLSKIMSAVDILNKVNNIIKELEILDMAENLQSINIGVIRKAKIAVETLDNALYIDSKLKRIQELPKEINIKSLRDTIRLINELKNIYSIINKIKELSERGEELEKLVAESGIKYTVCNSCGNLVNIGG